MLVLETMGRDAYRIDGADPRYVQQPLGLFSPGAFLVDFTWNSSYRTIAGAQLLAAGVENSSVFSATDKAGAKGFARTIQALEYIKLIETREWSVGSGNNDPTSGRSVTDRYDTSTVIGSPTAGRSPTSTSAPRSVRRAARTAWSESGSTLAARAASRAACTTAT